MQTQTLSGFDPNSFFPQMPATAGRTVNAQVEAIQATTDFSGTVSVVTAEGDKVTFSADGEADFRYMNYGYRTQGDGNQLEVEGTYAESSLSQTLGLTVEGELNEQEIADLTKLFKVVKNIFRKFFSGQDEQAVAKMVKLAEQFGNFSELDRLDLSADLTRTVTAQAAQLATQPGAEPDVQLLPSGALGEGNGGSLTPQRTAVDGTPPLEASIPQSSTGTESPAQPVSIDPAAAPLQATTSAQEHDQSAKSLSLIAQVLKALENVRIEDTKLQKYLPRLLRKAAADAGAHEAVQKKPDMIKETLEAFQKKTHEQASLSQEVLFAYSSSQRTAISLSVRA